MYFFKSTVALGILANLPSQRDSIVNTSGAVPPWICSVYLVGVSSQATGMTSTFTLGWFCSQAVMRSGIQTSPPDASATIQLANCSLTASSASPPANSRPPQTGRIKRTIQVSLFMGTSLPWLQS